MAEVIQFLHQPYLGGKIWSYVDNLEDRLNLIIVAMPPCPFRDNVEKDSIKRYEARQATKKNRIKLISGYQLFFKQNYKSIWSCTCQITPTDRIRSVGQIWKNLSDQDKDIWNDLSRAYNERRSY